MARMCSCVQRFSWRPNGYCAASTDLPAPGLPRRSAPLPGCRASPWRTPHSPPKHWIGWDAVWISRTHFIWRGRKAGTLLSASTSVSRRRPNSSARSKFGRHRRALFRRHQMRAIALTREGYVILSGADLIHHHSDFGGTKPPVPEEWHQQSKPAVRFAHLGFLCDTPPPSRWKQSFKFLAGFWVFGAVAENKTGAVLVNKSTDLDQSTFDDPVELGLDLLKEGAPFYIFGDSL